MTRDEEAQKIIAREDPSLGRVNWEDETAAVAEAIAAQLAKNPHYTHLPRKMRTNDASLC